jgi:hypothetical protein
VTSHIDLSIFSHFDFTTDEHRLFPLPTLAEGKDFSVLKNESLNLRFGMLEIDQQTYFKSGCF